MSEAVLSQWEMSMSRGGPFIYFLGFLQYLVPLLVLELYFRARDHQQPASQIAVATLIVALTLYMATGIFAASKGIWLLRLQVAAI